MLENRKAAPEFSGLPTSAKVPISRMSQQRSMVREPTCSLLDRNSTKYQHNSPVVKQYYNYQLMLMNIYSD